MASSRYSVKKGLELCVQGQEGLHLSCVCVRVVVAVVTAALAVVATAVAVVVDTVDAVDAVLDLGRGAER